MSYFPSREFCERNRLPHPLDPSLYDPKHFTFDGLEQTLLQLLGGNIHIVDPVSVKKMVTSCIHTQLGDLRVASLTIPVCFSPTNALKMMDVLHSVELRTRKAVKATFLFGTTMGYNPADPKVREIIATLSNRGHNIGLLVDLYENTTAQSVKDQLTRDMSVIKAATRKAPRTMGFHSIGIAPQQTIRIADDIAFCLKGKNMVSLHDEFFRDPAVAICATRNGLYKGGHPVDLFGRDMTKRIGVLQLSEFAYADTEMTPVTRVRQLPEMGENGATEFQIRLGMPLYGAAGTFEQDNPMAIAYRQGLRPGGSLAKHLKQMSG